MSTSFAVLPSDLIQTITAKLEEPHLQFLRLPHPRTGIPCLFLPYLSETSATSRILEVQAVSPPDSRSWFLGEEVVSDGKLLIATPIDPTFLLLPILQNLRKTHDAPAPATFRQSDDIFEEAAAQLRTADSPDVIHLGDDIIRFGALECTRDAMKNICDVKDISPEIVVYRLSHSKVLEYLRSRVTRVSSPGALETSKSTVRTLAKDGLMEDGKESLLEAGRLKATCDLIGQYLSSELREALLESYDFGDLDKYLKDAAEEITATADTKSGKKAKSQPSAPEDKKRKAVKGSQGVEKLKKANINGMAKLSTFFKKKE